MNYKIKVYRHFEKDVKKLSKRYKSLKQDLTILAAEERENITDKELQAVLKDNGII